ncbi:MAG: hypothetical protein Q8J93_03635 [Xanthomonadales bacterium]|nr:hypothetical protein [Xanthomonadales bacterium]MDZ4115067.1 hypothetical protein [Xanthomonadaceae bacterium]MDZ4377511.1 hypothetical protein [Xanthomonadaceae bacterium]
MVVVIAVLQSATKYYYITHPHPMPVCGSAVIANSTGIVGGVALGLRRHFLDECEHINLTVEEVAAKIVTGRRAVLQAEKGKAAKSLVVTV